MGPFKWVWIWATVICPSCHFCSRQWSSRLTHSHSEQDTFSFLEWSISFSCEHFLNSSAYQLLCKSTRKKSAPLKNSSELLADANVGLEGAPTGGGYFSLNACGCNTLRAGCFTHLRTQCCLGNQSFFFVFCFFLCKFSPPKCWVMVSTEPLKEQCWW